MELSQLIFVNSFALSAPTLPRDWIPVISLNKKTAVINFVTKTAVTVDTVPKTVIHQKITTPDTNILYIIE